MGCIISLLELPILPNHRLLATHLNSNTLKHDHIVLESRSKAAVPAYMNKGASAQ